MTNQIRRFPIHRENSDSFSVPKKMYTVIKKNTHRCKNDRFAQNLESYYSDHYIIMK